MSKIQTDGPKVVFVTGKGGVGKSHVALQLARQFAGEGQSTLLVELGEYSYYSFLLNKFLNGQMIEHAPKQVSENLFVAKWSGESCLKEYAKHLIKIDSLVELFFNNPVSRTLINIAPALPELAILGKITSGFRKVGPALNYNVLVVDGFAFGHFEALLKAPKAMAAAVPLGPMGEQSRGIDETLKLCEFYLVTLSEELPVTELIEYIPKLEALTQSTAKIVLNKWIQLKTIPDGETEFEQYLKAQNLQQSLAVDRLRSITGSIYTSHNSDFLHGNGQATLQKVEI